MAGVAKRQPSDNNSDDRFKVFGGCNYKAGEWSTVVTPPLNECPGEKGWNLSDTVDPGMWFGKTLLPKIPAAMPTPVVVAAATPHSTQDGTSNTVCRRKSDIDGGGVIDEARISRQPHSPSRRSSTSWHVLVMIQATLFRLGVMCVLSSSLDVHTLAAPIPRWSSYAIEAMQNGTLTRAGSHLCIRQNNSAMRTPSKRPATLSQAHSVLLFPGAVFLREIPPGNLLFSV